MLDLHIILKRELLNMTQIPFFPQNTKYFDFVIPGIIKSRLGNEVYEYFGKLPNPKNAKNFAFLVHPMQKDDYKFLVNDPKTVQTMQKWIEKEKKALARFKKTGKGKKPNLVNSLYNGMGNKIIGYIGVEVMGKICYGYMILVPYLPEQFIEALNGNDELKKEIISSIKKACDIAENMNCSFIGLGAYISIITQTIRGNILSDYTNIPITSGNDLTAGGIMEGVKLAIQYQHLSIEDLVITIIGASGSVGRPVSELIAELPFKKIILNARKANKLKENFGEIVQEGKLEISTNLKKSIRQSDIVVIAISSTKEEFAYNPNWFKPNTIICDASRPLVIGKELISARPDLKIFEGAIFQIPGCLIEGYKFLRMGDKNQAYGCLTSTCVYALNSEEKSSGNGIVIDKKQVKKILKKSKELGIKTIGVKFMEQKIIF